MDETKRFLRYIIPGLIFFIEVALYLTVSAFCPFVSCIKYFNTPDKTGIGTVVVIFLTSGGLGFIFSNIYYFFHNYLGVAVDQRDLLVFAENQGWIKLTNSSSKEITRLGAWRIVTALWKSKIETSPKVKSANPRMDSLADILHGLGTSTVASFLAIVLWAVIHKMLVHNWPWESSYLAWIAFFISFLLVVVFILNYISTRMSVQSIVSLILSDELRKGWPVEIDVNKHGLVRTEKK